MFFHILASISSGDIVMASFPNFSQLFVLTNDSNCLRNKNKPENYMMG